VRVAVEVMSWALLLLHLVVFVWAARIVWRIGMGRRVLSMFLVAGATILMRDVLVIAITLVHETPSWADAVCSRVLSALTTLLMAWMLAEYANRLGALERRDPSTLGEIRAFNGKLYSESREVIKQIDECQEGMRKLRETLDGRPPD